MGVRFPQGALSNRKEIMALVEILCTNPDCPGYEGKDECGVVTGHSYLADEIPATHVDPGYIKGSCDLCGEESDTYDVERLSPWDIEMLRAMNGPNGDRI